MGAREFNDREIEAGRLTAEHIVGMLGEAGLDLATVVRMFQRKHDLLVDGKAGTDTRAAIGRRAVARAYPLRKLPDGRKPVITSRFKTRNPDRPTHNGIDLFFAWLDSDPEVPCGDGGAIKRRGKRRWWYPPGCQITAAAAGEVTCAGKIGTGWRLWIDHGDGTRTGYFHCKRLLVDVGARVEMGDAIAEPGDSPKGYDAAHLHFEVSPANRYKPQDPELWLAGARCLPAEPA